MVDSDTGEPREPTGKLYRFVEGIIQSLESAGVRIIDPIGRNYDPGMALKVLSFEATPGLSGDRITETVRPTILWHDQILRIGEVIVGTPERTGADDLQSRGNAAAEDPATNDHVDPDAAPEHTDSSADRQGE